MYDMRYNYNAYVMQYSVSDHMGGFALESRKSREEGYLTGILQGVHLHLPHSVSTASQWPHDVLLMLP